MPQPSRTKNRDNAGSKAPAEAKLRSTRDLLLDAAESAFAAHGFHGVPLRLVANRAGQKLGTLSYHFKTKDDLFRAVVARRAEVLFGELAAILSAEENPGIELLVDAFLRPFVDRIEEGDPGWRHYPRILAEISQDPDWGELVDDLFGEAGRAYIVLIQKAVPGLSHDNAVRGYAHMLAGMFGFFSTAGLIDRLSGGSLRGTALRENLPDFVRFVVGGIRALAEQ